MAGYSGTPLAKKLGIKAEHKVAILGAPSGFVRTLEGLPDDVTLREDVRGHGELDVILFFAKSVAALERRFASLARRLSPAGGLWIAWPKKASGVKTDLSDGAVRTVGLREGLVDNKSCAVDETWSGLRFVVRLRDRA